ncbi:MAG: CDP-glucose 4,6-dehydratase [Planctomycetaceae bacterium]|nr:CDP-glucose 4,6-dehydratase [Planctomycetaceae bacterium]
MRQFNNVYKDKRVFLTGHTGFKGSWLALWLERLGADVCGFSLQEPVSEPDHFSLLSTDINDGRGDIRDYASVQNAIQHFAPEIVFHLAAQPLVRKSYTDPLETFSTNIQGTANLLQACRFCDSVRAIVVVTTDKVYENREWDWGYRETDPLGGHDPYAASKACAEMVAAGFRNSFFEENKILLATCRAGNVIGGGDWAADRIVPDMVRAAASGEATVIRMPHAVRPWEHVLEPLAGYLLLGQKLLEGEKKYAQAWNFGPDAEGIVTVGELAEHAQTHWNALKINMTPQKNQGLYETSHLALDCSKAKRRLGWKSVWSLEETVKHTMDWYREYYENKKIATLDQLSQFAADAQGRKAIWTSELSN